MSVQDIYNTYLSVSRGHKNKPWKPRKDFTGFDKTEEGLICVRLELFFSRFPQISVKDFLLAPYLLYKDEDYFPLKFYLTQKAISTYSIIQKQKLEEMPDSESHLADIVNTIKYIAELCVNENISFNTYINDKKGYTWRVLQEYVDRKINLYVLLSLPNFWSMIDSLTMQDKELYLGTMHKDITKYQMRLNNSARAKKIITEAFKRLSRL
jgi:hypothetical protein